MKRFLITFAFVICFFAFIKTEAEAFVAPVESNDNYISLYEEQTVCLEYVDILIQPMTDYFTMTADIVVTNNGSAREMEFGIPYYFYSGLSNVTGISISRNGVQISPVLKNTAPDPEIPLEAQKTYSYYCFKVPLNDNETILISFVINVSVRHYKNNMQCIDLPLSIFDYWVNSSGQIDIKLESRHTKIYSYDKAPNISPDKILETGALVWNFKTFSGLKNLIAYNNIDHQVIRKFFLNTYTSADARNAATLFGTHDYASAIAIIDEKLSSDINFLFLKMVCLEELGRKADVHALLQQLYSNADIGFSTNSEYDISEYIRKRMYYSYYNSCLETVDDYKYLANLLGDCISTLSLSRSSVFISWVNDEIEYLNVHSGKEAGTQIGKPSGDNDNSTDKNDTLKDNDMKAFTWLEQLNEPVIIIVGIVLVVVVVFCMWGMLSNMNTKKSEKKRLKRR